MTLWVSCAALGVGGALFAGGCGFLIGDVPNPADGGGGGGMDAKTHDGTTVLPDGRVIETGGGNPDGGQPGKDGGGGSPDVVVVPDGGSSPDAGTSVLEYHAHPSRDGHYIDSLMTPSYAGGLTVDTGFDGTIQGPLWGQPLYVQNGVGGKGTFYVADDNNNVYALDETTGKSVWPKTISVGTPAGAAGSGCGNVTPVGVTSAPYIDLGSRTMYIGAAVGTGSSISTYQIHALSIDTGAEATGWPLDISTITSSGGTTFNPPPQSQRGGLALVNGLLYVAFGGEDGDCGDYHGWVVSIPLSNPKGATGFATAGHGGGMWAVGGMPTDGTDVFVVSGNGGGSSTWADVESEAVFRFHDGTSFDPTNTANFFTPSNWPDLDANDIDLVGAGPMVVDVPGATPSALVVAMGKSGVMHLLSRANLGGIGTGNGTTGEGLFSSQIGSADLRGAGATYASGGNTYIVVHTDGSGNNCAIGSGDLVSMQITATNPPTLQNAWCVNSGGNGSPIVTTTDSAGSNPIVWIVGTEGSNQLTGWDGIKGTPVFTGAGVTMDQVIHWTTMIEANGKIIVGSNDKLYVFK